MSDPDRLVEIQAGNYEPPEENPRQAQEIISWLVGEVEGLRTELAAALGGWQREAEAMIELGREVERLRKLVEYHHASKQGRIGDYCQVCQERGGVLPEREVTPHP